MNKGPKLIAVLVVIFIFGIHLLVFESYQSLFSTFDKNENNYLAISTIKENDEDNNDEDNNDEDNNDDGGFDAKLCNKLYDTEICKKIEEEIKSKEIQSKEIKSSNKKLTKEEIQAEEITNKYLEPVNPPNPPSPVTPPPATTSHVTPPPATNNSPPLANVNTLDENQLIDAIASEISKLKNFDKNSITQALFELTQATAAQGGDVLKNLRQIGTTILQN